MLYRSRERSSSRKALIYFKSGPKTRAEIGRRMSYGLVRGALAVGHWNQAILQFTADHLGVGKQQLSEFPEDTFRLLRRSSTKHCRRANSLSEFATAIFPNYLTSSFIGMDAITC
ncbi:hypothetical protein TNCT_647601 [Trichonephila clavata]|uniref:Uncharacterized protein n=1 Tax=Trichonephila clavata TaxID=2740835 RepID=A0A8X6JEB4_TRICU|nr:hypothetical protein TNCT_647601 [Trichonephila clavata]